LGYPIVRAEGYVLRIASKTWVDHVFDMAIYYTNLCRKWEAGQAAIFVHKVEHGDAIIGYGIVESAGERERLPEEEKGKHLEHDWKKAITFKYVVRFNRPLPVRETFLGDPKYRGRYCHGLELSRRQVDTLISQAESLQH